jgi:hypothetical protein
VNNCRASEGGSRLSRSFRIQFSSRRLSESGPAGRHDIERHRGREQNLEANMEFILMAYVQEGGWDRLTPEQQVQGMAAYNAYAKSLADAGVLKVNRRLGRSAEAATLRSKDGKPQVLDGPEADSKEQLGGFYILDVADRAAAMRWAAKCPAVGHGVVELREIPSR